MRSLSSGCTPEEIGEPHIRATAGDRRCAAELFRIRFSPRPFPRTFTLHKENSPPAPTANPQTRDPFFLASFLFSPPISLAPTQSLRSSTISRCYIFISSNSRSISGADRRPPGRALRASTGSVRARITTRSRRVALRLCPTSIPSARPTGHRASREPRTLPGPGRTARRQKSNEITILLFLNFIFFSYQNDLYTYEHTHTHIYVRRSIVSSRGEESKARGGHLFLLLRRLSLFPFDSLLLVYKYKHIHTI